MTAGPKNCGSGKCVDDGSIEAGGTFTVLPLPFDEACPLLVGCGTSTTLSETSSTFRVPPSGCGSRFAAVPGERNNEFTNSERYQTSGKWHAPWVWSRGTYPSTTATRSSFIASMCFALTATKAVVSELAPGSFTGVTRDIDGVDTKSRGHSKHPQHAGPDIHGSNTDMLIDPECPRRIVS